MSRTIVAVYDSFYAADKAVQDLRIFGSPYELVNILPNANGVVREEKVSAPEVQISSPWIGVQIGVGIGFAMGFAAAVISTFSSFPLMLFSSAPVWVLLTSLTAAGALSGGIFGFLFGSLFPIHIPEEEIRQYARNVHTGNVVITILADWDYIDPILEILHRHSPVQIREKVINHQDVRQTHFHNTASRFPRINSFRN